MSRADAFDVAVIGGAFGGTLTAMCLAAQGRSVVVLERERHPRFRIGESSTPLADMALHGLAQRYGLAELIPLTRYGPWKRTVPELGVGPKRGFSFFHHRPGAVFEPREDRATELLVAANPSEERADTHWFRADVDNFFARRARARGVDVREGVEVTAVERNGGWRLRTRALPGAGEAGGEPGEVRARFLVDASGGGAPLTDVLGLEDASARIRTRSRTIYTHFEGVRRWAEVYDALGGSTEGYPFPADDAALHHVTPEGWWWFLRFDHGITSVGVVLSDLDAGASPEVEWAALLARYPSIAAHLDGARAVRPFVRTARLQRLQLPVAGADWCRLPTAAGFLDPLMSPGNAFTLFGVERLVEALEAWPDEGAVARALERHAALTVREVELLDAMIDGCYAGFDAFPLAVAFSMYYFAGATFSEVRRERGEGGPGDGFLNAHDDRFHRMVLEAWEDARSLTRNGRTPAQEELTAFEARVRHDIAPYNLAGLCDPAKRNLYPYV